MVDKARNLALGRAGEEAVSRHLAGKGWRIMARNWRPGGESRGLELDIVAEQDRCLVFVEVKTRRLPREEEERDQRADREGGPDTRPLHVPAYTALTPAKQNKLLRAAGHYLTAHDLWSAPCRFDLICVGRLSDGQLMLEHYSDVIEFRQVVDSGNAPWQPW